MAAPRNRIVKIQLPLSPKGAPALVYEQDRRRIWQVYVDKRLEAKMDGRPRAYFYAYLSTGDRWVIGNEAPDHEW